MPTILEAAGVSYPREVGGHAIQPADGESLMALLDGKAWTRAQPIYWEHEGNCAVRIGNFKLVRQFGKDWELYDMEKDRTELHDLAGKNHPLEKQLKQEYSSWAKRIGVEDWDKLLPQLKKLWEMDDIHG